MAKKVSSSLAQVTLFESEVLNLMIYFFIGTLPVPLGFTNMIFNFFLKGIDLSFTGRTLGGNSEFGAKISCK